MHLRSGNYTHLIPTAFGGHTENKQQHRPLPGNNGHRNRKPRRIKRRKAVKRGPAAAAVFNKKHKIPQTRLLYRSRGVFQQRTERIIDVIDGTVTTVTRNRNCLYEYTCDDFLDDDTALPRWGAKKKRKLNNHFHLQTTTTTTEHSNSSELRAFAMAAAAAAQSLPGTGSGCEVLFSTHSLENMVESQPQGPLLLKNAIATLAAPETPPKNHYQYQYHRKRKFDHPSENMYDEKEHQNGNQKQLFVDLGHPPSPGPSSYPCTCTCPCVSRRHCAQEQQIPDNAKIVVEITCEPATIDTASAIADENRLAMVPCSHADPPPPGSAYADFLGDDRPLAPVTPDKLKHRCDGDGGTVPVKSRESGFSQQHQEEEEEEDMCDNDSPPSEETEAEAEELLVDGKKPRRVKPKRKKHRARVMKEAKPNKVSVSNQEKPQRVRSSKPQAVARGRPKGKGKGKTQKKCDEEPTTTTKGNNNVVAAQLMFDQALPASSIPVAVEMPSDFAGNSIVGGGGGFKKMRYRKLLKSINQTQFRGRAVSRESERLKSIARRRDFISKAMSHLLSELTKEKNNIFFNIPRKRRTPPPVYALDTRTSESKAYMQQEEEADSFNLPPLPDPISFQMPMLPSNYSSGSGSGSGCAFEESDISLVHQQGLTWDNYMKGGYAEHQQLVVYNPSSAAAAVTPSDPTSYHMVTYEGPFIEQIKSKLKKPAVVLEDEIVSARYWEAERDLFKTRAEYFIKCMREAQGDRRFHPWKGSVLDSVIGVFLTQNVSDQLSSSAFISLASRFPPVGQEEDDASIITESMDGCEGSDINIMQNFFDCSPAKPLENVSCLSTECDTKKDTKRPNNANANNEMEVNKIQMSSNAYQIAIDNLQIVGERVESTVVNNLPMETSERMCKQFSYLALVTSDVDLDTSTNLSTSFLNDCPTPSLPSNNPSSISDTSPTSEAVLYPHFPLCGSEAAFCPDLHTRTECTPFFPNTKPVSDSLSTPSFPETVASSMTDSPNQDGVEYRNSIDHANVAIEKQVINELCTNLTLGLSNENENGGLTVAFQDGANINTKKGKKVRGKRYPNANTAVDDVDSNIKVSYCKISGIARADIEMNEGKSRHNLDWDAIGKLNVKNENRQKHRDPRFRDAVNWDAVRCADLEDIANSIKFRGMNYMLAGRIKGFLERVHEDCGSIDLEWLRTVPGHEAKNFLRSVWGLGLKSVECIRLLALHQIAFPVDTNVGRIAVRLGWVPIQLPRDVQIHLVELYPSLEKVQMYLWPRLCTLDQATLYELHYQMITFGKVFCTKTKPKCHACPMQNQCKHFASARASAQLALPDARSAPNYTPPPLTSAMEDNVLTIADNLILNYPVISDSMLQSDEYSSSQPVQNNCPQWTYQPTIEEVYEPIIEEPASPYNLHYTHDLDYIESSESADSNDIPVINLSHSPQDFCSSIGNHKQYVEDTGTLVQSNAVIPLPASTARLPVRPLKRSSRLRTEHDVYELPDSHQLLEGIEPREIDDPCPYLLTILTPEEVKESSRVAESCSSSISSENFDDKQYVKGTLLIPCRTAMRGSFPLNGTYFQVNEVFADHETSLRPKDVPRNWIWHLNKRLVCFGTSITSIFRDANSDQINYCFKEGYVCVRGFDRKTRAPKPLVARLHVPPTKKEKAKQNEEMRESESKTRGRRKSSNKKQENLDLHESSAIEELFNHPHNLRR